MDWAAVDVLIDQLDEAFRRGDFRDLGDIPTPGSAVSMDAELIARMVLADVDHHRNWIPASEISGGRLDKLADEIRFLLSFVGASC